MYIEIKKGTDLPEDFVINGTVNRDRYIVEMGFSDLDKWYDEHYIQPNIEMIGAIVIGSNQYNSIRYRSRQDADKKFDITKTLISKLIK